MLNGCWENSEKLWGATFLLHPVEHNPSIGETLDYVHFSCVKVC